MAGGCLTAALAAVLAMATADGGRVPDAGPANKGDGPAESGRPEPGRPGLGRPGPGRSESGVAPSAEPPPPSAPTPWALAGARGWRLCHDAEQQAKAARRGGPRGGTGGPEDVLWARRAEQCPHAPAVLAVAGEREIVQAAELLAGVEDWEAEQLAQVVAEHRRRMRRALGWLAAAIEESARRGQPPPPETYYYRAYALTTLGDVARARRAIAVAAANRDVAAHRLQRMAALIHLFEGDLNTALRLAHRAVVDAPADGDRLISRYIYALVLDRVGALHSAAQAFKALQHESGRYQARLAVESVLPVHERLFLRALDHQVAERSSAASHIWRLYLGLGDPQAPERVLARRHRAEIGPGQ